MAKQIVIIGGGASGLAAAVAAAGAGAAVTVVEHKDRVGKKLLMTGNGKCNLTNMSDFHGKYYSSGKSSLARIYGTLERFNASDTRAFFQSLGLYTREKRDGGVYPMGEQASTVLDVLRSACRRRGVRFLTNCEVYRIEPAKNGGRISYTRRIYGQPETKNKKGREPVREEKASLTYDRLILAAGSQAAPATGADGSGYMLARQLGHSIVPVLPALVQLRCAGGYFKSIAGVRAQAAITLYVDGTRAADETGELQLTDYGISGIPVFQISRIAAVSLYHKQACTVSIDFLACLEGEPSLNGQEGKGVEEFLSGMVHKKLAALICRRHGIGAQETVAEAGAPRVLACIYELRHFEVTVSEPNSFENAQVCSGGVPLSEVSEDFASLKCPDVYLVGELLDCDGICGGYNLQWAWATGILAGEAAAGRPGRNQ